ncbi:MAG: hypothetical protein JRJ59_08230 [Deltaproteobacteria bacterium]|nr:hypothetical protein [Deltaproteobacteria bacterium]
MPPFTLYRSENRLSAAAVGVGLTAGLGQVVILRELMVLAGGNELSLGLGLACWLTWGGLGSLATGLWLGRVRGSGLIAPLLIVGLGGGLSLALARLAPWLLGLNLGMVPSLGQILLISLTVLGPVGWADGAAFPLILAAATQEGEMQPRLLPRLYGLEALGHALAAALFGLVVVKFLDPAGVILGAGLVGAVLGLAAARGRVRWLVLVWLALTAVGLLMSGSIDSRLRTWQWRGRSLIGWAESPYAQFVAVQSQDQIDFFSSGLWTFSHPDRKQVERSALLPLLARPGAEQILFIGGLANGVAAEAARRSRSSQVTAVELDPWQIEFAARHLLGRARPPNLTVKTGDGRSFLENRQNAFDLIVVDLPPPVTIQLNRYYSQEGLGAMARALRPGGVAVISLPGMESLIGQLQVKRLASILAAARTAFSHLAMMSGPDLRIFVSNDPKALPDRPQAWQERLASRGWTGLVEVRPDVLELETDPFRLAQLSAIIDQAGPQLPNSDLRPRTLLLDPQMWGAQLGGRTAWAEALANFKNSHLFLPLIGLAILFFLAALKTSPGQLTIPVGVVTTGLTSTALSVLLLMAYQALVGAVYVGLAVLLAGFMLGLAGAAVLLSRSRRSPRSRPLGLILLTCLIILACLASLALIRLSLILGSGSYRSLALVLMALLDGGLTGAYFGLAGRLRLEKVKALIGKTVPSPLAREGGKLYGLDLIGGLTGALLPVVLVPTLGLSASLISLALVNLIPLAGYLSQTLRPRLG